MMDRDMPAVSVVIPTRNRSDSLRRTLDALGAQTVPPSMMEVVLVLDACTDGTKGMLERHEAHFSVRTLTIDPPHRGPAVARNLGARSARGALLLFLDDDVVPDPHLVQAHLDAHQANPDSVVLGPYWPCLQPGADCFRVMQHAWWNDKFVLLQQYGRRFSYTDVLSGNLSVQTRHFQKLGGFDEHFPVAHEDYELGLRLIQAGLNIVVARDATARHYEHEHMTIENSFRRARMEGRADILIAHRHASLVQTLPFASWHEQAAFSHRIVRSLAYNHPSLGDRLADLLSSFLPVLDRCRIRRGFHRLYKGLRYYWYLRGVAQEAGSMAAVSDLLAKHRMHDHSCHEIEVDLRDGLPQAEARVDHERPAAVRLWYGQQFIGRIPSQPGAEPLRGRHLRPVLAASLAWPYLMALVMDTAKKPQGVPPPNETFHPLDINEPSHAGKSY